MKQIKTLLFVLSTSLSFSQNGQIENGGFEIWQNDTIYENPTVWSTSNDYEFFGTALTTKSTDANDGSFSMRVDAEVIGTDTLSGYFFHGSLDFAGGNGPNGGIPYTDNFEAFMVDYKGDLQVNDTLYLLLIRYLAGNAVDFQVKPLFFGTQSTWNSSVIFVGNQAQDSLFLAFTLGDPNGNNKPNPNSWALIDNIRLLSGGAPQTNIPNHSFENWSPKTTENPYAWYTMNEVFAGSNTENVTKTTDANSGQYAVRLETYLNGNDTINAYLSVGSIDFFNGTFGSIPYNATPTTVSGMYKYTSVNGSTGELTLLFYQGGNAIGYHAETFTAQTNYTAFNSALSIVGTPDSVLILVQSGSDPGSVLILDDLSFSGNDVSIDEILTIDFQLYPNPATNEVSIRLPEGEVFDITLTDLSGKVVLFAENCSSITPITLMSLESGIYTVRVSNSRYSETKRLIKH